MRGNYFFGARFLALFATVSVAVAAHAQVGLLGTLYLDSDGYADGSTGPFQWLISNAAGTPVGGVIDTYCFSIHNDFAPGDKPQVYTVYSIGDLVTLGDVNSQDLTAQALLPLIQNNGMFATGTVAQDKVAETDFLEAVWKSEGYGPADITNGAQSGVGGWNDVIHGIEASGGGPTSPPGNGMSFWYLQQTDPFNYANGGQPQGFVFPGGGGNIQLTPEPITMALGIAGLGLALRRRAARR